MLQPLPAVAFDQAFDQQEQIGPHRLRPGEAAPQTPGPAPRFRPRGARDLAPELAFELAWLISMVTATSASRSPAARTAKIGRSHRHLFVEAQTGRSYFAACFDQVVSSLA